jgi:hypothetical protein
MNSTNSTRLPTSEPTLSPTEDSGTPFPTISPTPKPTFYPTDDEIEDESTPSPTTYIPASTSAPTYKHDVEIIQFPSYENKDPVDGIFIVLAIILMIVSLVACFQSVRNDRIRANY